MRIVVDMDMCESNALCMALAPEVFDLGEDDVLVLLDEHPDERLRVDVEAAVANCPKQALRLEVGS